jgi:superfamily II DNA or RNA helicase
MLDALDFADAPAPASDLASGTFMLRDYQLDALEKLREGWAQFRRQLAVLATGCGKTVIFSRVAAEEVAAGGRVLILAHTDELLDQAADKLQRSTGLVAEKEKASDRASLSAGVVVGSVQTLCLEARLTGWPENHFALVIVDEAHRSLAPSYQRVLRYFHFGAASLDEGWKMPEPGVPFASHARILGVTATADRGDKRSLGEFYESCPVDYGLLQAVRDGYLVRPIAHSIPLQIDLRGVKVARTGQGSDYDLTEVTARITPFLREIARHIAENARDRKTVCFLPGIETARLLSEALCEQGIDAQFVSGACDDRAEKLEWFDGAGRRTAMCNAMLLTEGWDCPDVSCVCVLRPTKIRSLYVQCVGRGTRPLTGTIDGLGSAAERIAAIAASAKPDLRILDFLWLSDNLSLIKPLDLVAAKPEIRERMAKDGSDGDLIHAEERANRDLLKSLERATREHAKKKARVIDPLAWAVSLGDAALATWEPESKWDELPPTPGQISVLEKNGIDLAKVTARGMATRIIDRVFQRQKLGLCTPKQLTFMERLGIRDAALVTFKEASALIDARIRKGKAEAGAPAESKT